MTKVMCNASPRVCLKWWNGGVFVLNWLSMLRGPSIFHTHTGTVLFSVEAVVFSLSPSIKAIKFPDIYRATKWDLNYTLQQSRVMPSRACLREVLHISFIHYVCTFVCLHFKISVGFISEQNFLRLQQIIAFKAFYRRWWIPRLFFNWNKCWGATINIISTPESSNRKLSLHFR